MTLKPFGSLQLVLLMPRARAISQPDFPYNISARCINREWFHISMPRVWEMFCEELARTSKEKSLTIHSFVLMSNHFHLIASTPQSNISECMHQFMRNVSRRLTREGNRINETFAGRHFKCILDQHNYYLNAYKYNYRNPIAAGICERVEDYPYSSLQAVMKNSELRLPIDNDTTFNSDPAGILDWLNTAPDPSKLEGVKFGLKRQYFRSKKCKNNMPLISVTDIL